MTRLEKIIMVVNTLHPGHIKAETKRLLLKADELIEVVTTEEPVSYATPQEVPVHEVQQAVGRNGVPARRITRHHPGTSNWGHKRRATKPKDFRMHLVARLKTYMTNHKLDVSQLCDLSKATDTPMKYHDVRNWYFDETLPGDVNCDRLEKFLTEVEK